LLYKTISIAVKSHSRYGVGVGNFGKVGVGVGVGNIVKVGVGHFTSDFATLVDSTIG